MTEPEAAPPKKPRRRRVLRIVLFSFLALVVVLGLAAAATVYKPISRRAGSTLAAAQAPEFSLEDQSGATTTLAALTARGPAILVFYRGFW